MASQRRLSAATAATPPRDEPSPGHGARSAVPGRTTILMPGRVLNRRETHKRQTRAALEDAALTLFARQGYEETTVDDIAALAGVSVRTFFRYFASKQHVLFGDVAYRRVSQLGVALAQRPEGEDPVESVRAVLDATDITDPAELAPIRTRMRLLREQPSLIGTYLMINHELRRQVAAFVAQRCGLAETHPYPLMVSAAASAAWDVALMAWANEQIDQLAEVRKSTFEQLVSGVNRIVT